MTIRYAASPKTTGLSFSQALNYLKSGHTVARVGWNGKGMWLQLIEGCEYKLQRKLGSQLELSLSPWIGMKTVDNQVVPWLASQTDLLAEDWEIVQE